MPCLMSLQEGLEGDRGGIIDYMTCHISVVG